MKATKAVVVIAAMVAAAAITFLMGCGIGEGGAEGLIYDNGDVRFGVIPMVSINRSAVTSGGSNELSWFLQTDVAVEEDLVVIVKYDTGADGELILIPKGTWRSEAFEFIVGSTEVTTVTIAPAKDRLDIDLTNPVPVKMGTINVRVSNDYNFQKHRYLVDPERNQVSK